MARRPLGGRTAAVVACILAGSAIAAAPATAMPSTILDFLGQGTTNSATTQTGDPPDTTGAVGPNNYVQAVNGGIEVWDKAGAVVAASKSLNTLWAGYTGVNPGNGCATRNDGDPMVRYDRMADRWVIAQMSLPHSSTDAGPSFECVAVSKTANPTGAYWLYDFSYPYAVNDQVKLGVWPDAYYATFGAFGTSAFKGEDVCAWDRAAMLAGQPATQKCILLPNPNQSACPAAQSFTAFGVLPANADGSVPPPAGSPEYLMQFDASQCSGPYTQLDLWKFHVDWANPANSTLSAPTVLTVPAFTPPCNNNATPNCIPQSGSATTIDAVGDRLMDRLVYRNFGDHESLLLNHTVTAGAGAGIRWYEIRGLSTTPAVFQAGTYAPSDGVWRWMGSLAEDQAGDIALGFSASSSTQRPAIALTGRLASDPLNTMGQGEAIIDTGAAAAPNDTGTGRARWGDYSSMTVDPTDDCTFWYTNELYKASAFKGWDTHIASFRFPNCGANDFSIAGPAAVSAVQGSSGHTDVSTTLTKGSAGSVALYAQDLPPGASASFSPNSVTAGQSSTLTLTAGPSTPPGTYTVGVIGKAASAIHYTTVSFTVTSPPAPVCQNVSRSTTVNAGIQVSFACSNTSGVATTYAIVGAPSHGTLSGLDPASGTVTYTPDAGYLGADSFTYMATNAGGVSNTATAGITITDASAPSISIITPANGATYTEGQVINADYSCTDPDGSANVTKCTGPVASGTPLDTSTAGAHSFTVSASDVAGNGVSQTVQYTVASAGGPGASTPTIDTSRAPSVTASAGTVLVAPGISVSCPAGGDDCTADERATVSLARAKHTTIAVGKARVTIHAGSDRSLTFRLNRRGARLLRQHRRLRITVTVIARVGTNAPTTTIKTITIKPPSRKAHHSRVSRRL